MVRIIALALASALSVSTAFAGNLNDAMIEPDPVAPAATGSMGNNAKYALIGLGVLAAGAAIWAIADDDDDGDDSTGTTTSN